MKRQRPNLFITYVHVKKGSLRRVTVLCYAWTSIRHLVLLSGLNVWTSVEPASTASQHTAVHGNVRHVFQNLRGSWAVRPHNMASRSSLVSSFSACLEHGFLFHCRCSDMDVLRSCAAILKSFKVLKQFKTYYILYKETLHQDNYLYDTVLLSSVIQIHIAMVIFSHGGISHRGRTSWNGYRKQEKEDLRCNNTLFFTAWQVNHRGIRQANKQSICKEPKDPCLEVQKGRHAGVRGNGQE